jgi:hypothetical protein
MSRLLSLSVLGFVALGYSCARPPDVDGVPVGSEVQVTRQDGGVVEGRLADRNAQQLTINTGRQTRAIDRKAIVDIRIVDPNGPAPTPPSAARFREYTVPARTVLNVRLETTVASNTNREGDPVEALLIDPVVIDDRDVVPVGALVKGVVSEVAASGKVKGRAHLGLRFTSLVAHARGDEYDYAIAAHFARTAEPTKGDDAKKVGVGAAAGAIIGGVIGGGKGAAAGAAVGAGGGTAVVLATAGDEVKFDHGAVLSLALEGPVVVKVPITR